VPSGSLPGNAAQAVLCSFCRATIAPLEVESQSELPNLWVERPDRFPELSLIGHVADRQAKVRMID